MSEKLDIPQSGFVDLPNGCSLFWHTDEVGGRVYISDEVGGGVTVWHTTLVDSATLLAAMVQEAKLSYMEAVNKKRGF